MIKSQEQNHELHEAFHSQLEKSDDGFAVVADYFGRGVFNALPVVQTGAVLPPSIEPGTVPSPRRRPAPSSLTEPTFADFYKPSQTRSGPKVSEQKDASKRLPVYDSGKNGQSSSIEANLQIPSQEKANLK